MASYKKMKLVDLQNICEERGLTYRGLTKRALIELLIDADEQECAACVASDVDGDVENGQDGVPSDEEITFRPQPARRGANVAASTATSDRPGEGSESLEILRLKLQLAKEEKEEKERERQREREREEREMERERGRERKELGKTKNVSGPLNNRGLSWDSIRPKMETAPVRPLLNMI